MAVVVAGTASSSQFGYYHNTKSGWTRAEYECVDRTVLEAALVSVLEATFPTFCRRYPLPFARPHWSFAGLASGRVNNIHWDLGQREWLIREWWPVLAFVGSPPPRYQCIIHMSNEGTGRDGSEKKVERSRRRVVQATDKSRRQS